jgi:nucleotide-binding universal stress UspA family protein
MGSPGSRETFPPAENPQRSSSTHATPFRHIAVCVDGSEMGETLVRYAVTVAAAFVAPLIILRVLEIGSNTDTTPSDPPDWGVRQREAGAYLQQLVSLASHRDIQVKAELIQGRAAEQICHWALQYGADLTVLASHGGHGRSEWTLSSTARKLVEAAPGSLLLVLCGRVSR